jgi:hypothetical protein
MGNTLPAVLYGQILSASDGVPADIVAHRVKLVATRASVAEFGRVMDGMVFGMVGADGIISLIPVVGDIFSGLLIFWLVVKAGQVRMPLGDRLVIVGLGALDTAIGMTPVVGDIADFFFRAHGWSAKRVEAHIDMQLQQIDTVGPLPNDHPHMHQLRDALFRGGKTKQEVWRRIAIIAAACVALLGYCDYRADQAAQRRHENIVACQNSGGWFCELRN